MSTYPWAAGFIDDGDRPQIVTSRFQYDDSYTLERYHATGGYDGLKAALARTPGEVHEEVKAATVLGRGGAGFPAGTKWGLMPAGKYPRYLVVNGDESEPGTYKDRLLMERDPHQLVEGCSSPPTRPAWRRCSCTSAARCRWPTSASPTR